MYLIAFVYACLYPLITLHLRVFRGIRINRVIVEQKIIGHYGLRVIGFLLLLGFISVIKDVRVIGVIKVVRVTTVMREIAY
jgi:hypothetical protein